MFQRRPGFNHSKALRPTENRFCEEIHHRQSYFVRGRGVFTGQKSLFVHACCLCRTVCIEWSGTKTHSKRRSATAKARYCGTFTYTI